MIAIDYTLCGICFHKWHFAVVLAVGVTYLIINAVVSLTAFVVYPILTWRDVMTLVWVVACFLIVIAAFVLFYWLSGKKRIQVGQERSMISNNSRSDC